MAQGRGKGTCEPSSRKCKRSNHQVGRVVGWEDRENASASASASAFAPAPALRRVAEGNITKRVEKERRSTANQSPTFTRLAQFDFSVTNAGPSAGLRWVLQLGWASKKWVVGSATDMRYAVQVHAPANGVAFAHYSARACSGPALALVDCQRGLQRVADGVPWNHPTIRLLLAARQSSETLWDTHWRQRVRWHHEVTNQ
ncbi:hypothetical protein BKA67DRAFT_690967 [Truncatella angustata]|uniref:Uncharacterized protein n=1 Tax=Truncatella angustata TaxID=152316 RepID=A0A9P8UJX4_9PEZI|nr:uncharacterized protein BKA67DRAFT_690967 [Truncatella angustata]KAH6653860.1 hypothetical protein BKA67DRAFT_690967 [Truncatella angustata]